ncbi:MAG: hypothetical protein ACWIPH_08990 [Ostreibacterium sp.]
MASETCTKYSRTLYKFSIYCATNRLSIEALEKIQVVNYIEQLPFGAGQKQHYLCVIKQYYQFLIYRGALQKNPAKNIKPQNA